MNFKHLFSVALAWKRPVAKASEGRVFVKSHELSVNGKPTLAVSAAKAFKGDPGLHNPEDLLLASVTSCHMMSYMYCCERAGIELLSYSDASEAILETYENGSGRIVEVNLRPVVTITDQAQASLAAELHAEANKLCFIANSCNFKVNHQATIVVEPST